MQAQTSKTSILCADNCTPDSGYFSINFNISKSGSGCCSGWGGLPRPGPRQWVGGTQRRLVQPGRTSPTGCASRGPSPAKPAPHYLHWAKWPLSTMFMCFCLSGIDSVTSQWPPNVSAFDARDFITAWHVLVDSCFNQYIKAWIPPSSDRGTGT